MGARKAWSCGMLVLAYAQASIAQPSESAEPKTSDDDAPLHIDLVGSGVVEAPDTTFTLTAAGIETSTSADDEDDSFPDAVLVGNDKRFYCTGVVIDDRHVLTAAHCADGTRVGFGNRVESAIHVAITKSVRHPVLDVALLTMARPAKVRVHGRRTAADNGPPLGSLRFLGFGVKDHLRLTGFGTKRQVDIGVDGWGCTLARSEVIGCSRDDELVVRGQGNDTCLGDSGGPVFERINDGWRLVAITSRGMRPRKVICGEGGIYVRIDRISKWLDKEVGK